ncbi:hypothetical protein [Micromonospora sp. CB01531]|uniref:hypothetical protein n=1 Tax=Micromonospora sp. CB01531 TaxID=1718947 RepID=UPI00093FE4B9|nr:hypothetical protein [Micromonospora sp. CB01531]OKI45110.1 hypothetical protein A6A27_11875 [Micromonospora sp. CB01531]
MAQVYRYVEGQKFERFMADFEPVQLHLMDLLFAAKAKADVYLIENRQEGDAAIEIDHGDIDWYLTLSDERGQGAAMSIEYGRQAGSYEMQYSDGEVREIEYGASEGLYILHRALNVPRKEGRRKPVKVKGRRVKVNYTRWEQVQRFRRRKDEEA